MTLPATDKIISVASENAKRIFHHDIKRIGLMADTHGNLCAMETCIQRLLDFHVDMIIHLGDFFDSQRSEEAVHIIEIILKNHICTVKGNNDYQIENALKNNCLNHIPEHHRKVIHTYLAAVPLHIKFHNVCFTHSLPYDSIRSFYEPIDTGNVDRAKRIFHDTDYHVVFSGHSHFPILFRNRRGIVTREPVSKKTHILFQKDERYIIVVGSACEGESGVMDMTHMRYDRIYA